MPKIDVNKVGEILKKNQIDKEVFRRIVEEMNLAVQPESGDESTGPKVKQQYSVIISDPNGTLAKQDYVAWVVKLPENKSVATVLDRVYRGAYEFNASKKGRLCPVSTVGEAFENVPRKFFKEADLTILTQEPVLVIKSNNQIPKEQNAE